MFLIGFTGAQLIASLLIAQAAEAPVGETFEELGSLFIWGMAGAVLAAAVVVFIRLKIQSRREATSDYVSINPSKHSNTGVK